MVVGPLFKVLTRKRMVQINNWINGKLVKSSSAIWLEKFNPHSGRKISDFINSSPNDIKKALTSAESSFASWSQITPVERGQVLTRIVANLKLRSLEMARCVARETGKSLNDAKGEVNAAILQGEYFAGEGMRLYGRSLTSGMKGKTSFTSRQAHGVVGLIVPANTPIANIAWKVFPALICGNSVILKSSEDAPLTANLFAEICHSANIPHGILNILHGDAAVGAALVESSRIKLISFTGSSRTGIKIAESAARSMKRISLELGGKNPFVVCDDADIDKAVHWATLSAFSNAGQRCASGSRIIVFEEIYELFKKKFVMKALSLKLGIEKDCDLGPLINKKSYRVVTEMLENINSNHGAILCGGSPVNLPRHLKGYYIPPTIIECFDQQASFNCQEIFAPVASLSKVKNLPEALAIANASDYGLTASIHTQSIDRGIWFASKVKAGLANINFGTYGSEPHMPFGGFGLSSNGSREPGVEALDVYSELKNISILTRDSLI